MPITPTIREILWPLRGHHPEHVFTYIAVRTHRRWVKGQRYPVTLAGLRAHWHRLRKAAGVTGFRFHDFRHDFATKLLRVTGNLKLVQRASITPTFDTRCAMLTCSMRRSPTASSASRSAGKMTGLLCAR